MHRGISLGAAVLAASAVFALAGCSGTTVADPSGTATSNVGTPTDRSRPSTRPTLTPTPTPATPPTTVDPVLQHIYDVCAPHATGEGVTIAAPTPAATENDLSVSDGLVSMAFSVSSFADGHSDPYSIYLCSVSAKSTTATFVSGGMTDTH